MKSRQAAFTLVELLIVVAIIGLLLGLVTPAASNMQAGLQLNQNGQGIIDKLSLCRQLATTQNRDVELRFIDIPTSETDTGGQAFQIWLLNPRGGTAEAYGKIVRLPEEIKLNDDLSPMWTKLPSGTADFTALGGDRTYRAIRFRSNGRLARNDMGSDNYLTYSFRRDREAVPGNYYTLQINPVTGWVTTYRP